MDIVPEKAEMINNRKSPIQDDYIEKYLAEKDLNLTATLDAEAAYRDADFVVIVAPTMSTSNIQWRHDGLRWRIKLMQNTLLRACFIAEQEMVMIPSFFRRIKSGKPTCKKVQNLFFRINLLQTVSGHDNCIFLEN